jgi:hypothetical protein
MIGLFRDITKIEITSHWFEGIRPGYDIFTDCRLLPERNRNLIESSLNNRLQDIQQICLEERQDVQRLGIAKSRIVFEEFRRPSFIKPKRMLYREPAARGNSISDHW